LETGPKITFEDTKVLAKTSHYYARLHREPIEIHKQENNFNKKEESLKLNKTWFPAFRNRKIGNQSGIAEGRISTNQIPGRDNLQLDAGKTLQQTGSRHYKYA
jgi:hypothetical protein